MIEITLLTPRQPDWATAVDHLYYQLGGGNNPTLLPYHFLQVVLPQIGGHLACIQQGDAVSGMAVLLPRQQPGHFTLRLQKQAADNMTADAHVVQLLQQQLPGARFTLYDPHTAQSFSPTHQQLASGEMLVDIGQPDAAEAAAIRTFQQRIWGNPPEFLYPSDIHSTAFALGTSLVARVAGALAGFLIGFDKFISTADPVRLESQILGVLPEYRKLRIGALLKQTQAQQALARGLQVINWTADPLQYPNAALNFGLLRAVAFDFYADYYPFRNELNRAPASRLGLTWQIDSQPVQDALRHLAPATVLNVDQTPALVRVNDGHATVDLTATAPTIAIEIPTHWTALQQQDFPLAMRWRAATDTLFTHYLGSGPGKYVVTGVAAAGERRFLLAQRVDAG